jgi:hypothetical protein
MGRRLECSEASVRAIASGLRVPSRHLRKALQDVYSIAPGDFDWKGAARAHAEPGKLRTSKPKAPAVPSLGPTLEASTATLDTTDAKAVTESLVARLTKELDRMDSDPAATPRERASVSSSLTSATRLLARLSGALDVTPSQIMRSPHWRPIVAALVSAVAPFEGASAAVAKALRSFEGES